MCLLLREALVVGKIAIAHEFFSNELKLLEARLRIKDELSSYCVVTEPPKTTFGKVAQFALKNSDRARKIHAPSHALGRLGRRTRASSTANRTTCASRSNSASSGARRFALAGELPTPQHHHSNLTRP